MVSSFSMSAFIVAQNDQTASTRRPQLPKLRFMALDAFSCAIILLAPLYKCCVQYFHSPPVQVIIGGLPSFLGVRDVKSHTLRFGHQAPYEALVFDSHEIEFCSLTYEVASHSARISLTDSRFDEAWSHKTSSSFSIHVTSPHIKSLPASSPTSNHLSHRFHTNKSKM